MVNSRGGWINSAERPMDYYTWPTPNDKKPQTTIYILFSHRHVLNLFAKCSPVVGLQFRVFDALLAPILMQFTDVVLGLLEKDEFVTNALLYEHPTRMLVNN